MRIALLLTSLLFAACTVGEVGTSNNNAPDGGTKPGMDGSPTGNGCVNRAAASPPHTHALGGGTNAGMNCLAAGACHLNNSGANAGPPFQFAGTVFKSDGKTPNPGVMIRIKPVSGGPGGTMVSDEAGNFSLGVGSVMMAFPATTDVTACPTVSAMVSQVVANGGGACNSCHVAGGAAGTVITLPDQ
ncbi:MAG TPA: hypothetical protein VF469_11765 [Kofleriaceae bacterium]